MTGQILIHFMSSFTCLRALSGSSSRDQCPDGAGVVRKAWTGGCEHAEADEYDQKIRGVQ